MFANYQYNIDRKKLNQKSQKKLTPRLSESTSAHEIQQDEDEA